RRWFGNKIMRSVTMGAPPGVLFGFVKLLALLGSKIDRDLLLGFRPDRVGAAAGVTALLFQVRRRVVCDWVNFCQPFMPATKRPAKSFSHFVANSSRMVNVKEKLSGVKSPQSRTSDSAGDEHKDKPGDKFPL